MCWCMSHRSKQKTIVKQQVIFELQLNRVLENFSTRSIISSATENAGNTVVALAMS